MGRHPPRTRAIHERPESTVDESSAHGSGPRGSDALHPFGPRLPVRRSGSSSIAGKQFQPLTGDYSDGVTTKEELRDIVAAGENQGLEFNSVIPQVGHIARHLAAFANTSGGRLLLGIGPPSADDSEIAIRGVDPDRAINSIISASERVEPRPQVRTEIVPVDGRPVVIADVARTASVPVITAGVAYVRKDAFTTPATADDLLGRAVQKAIMRAPAHLDREPLRDTLTEALRGPTEAIERQSSEIQRLQASGAWQRPLLWVVIGVVLGTAVGIVASALIHLNG
jgi:Schlafen, AlbA_2